MLGKAFTIDNKYTEAEAAYRKAIEIDPEFVYAWNGLGDSLYSQNQLTEAEAAYKKAMEIIPASVQSNYSLGVALYFSGKLDESVKFFKHYLEHHPDDSLSHNNLGYVLLTKKQLNESRFAFLKAVELNPNCCLYYANLGIALCELGMINESSKCRDKAIEILSKIKPGAWDFNSLARLCLQQANKKYYPQAEEWIKQACKQSPNHSEYEFTYARLLAAQSKWEASLEHIKDFLVNANFARHFILEITELFINAAKEGYASESLELLNQSAIADDIEPLIVALQKYLEIQTCAPLEIYEVAKDIVSEIKDREAMK
jgi:tetratricopeptide (TPR) repeat protein